MSWVTTVPWADYELLKVGPYKLYYHADREGRITHVYLPGGVKLSLYSIRLLGLQITYPEVIRLS